MRHGMMIGELARVFNDACGIGADLTVVPMEHWRRPMHFDETGLPWDGCAILHSYGAYPHYTLTTR